MRIIDWAPLAVEGRGKIILEFKVTEFDEDKIRSIINRHIDAIQTTLEELELV